MGRKKGVYTIRILALDPSGNFTEGKGTTGWCVINESGSIVSFGQVCAKNFATKEIYWKAVISLVLKLSIDMLVVEDFLLYSNRAKSQINSRFETPKLIGILEYIANEHHIPIHLQRAVEVQGRWSDDILLKKGVLSKKDMSFYLNGVKVSPHIRDSVRHAMHYVKYGLNKTKEENA